MLKHRGISNLYVSIREILERAEGSILCSTSLIFDAFICETLLSLCSGRTIVLADEEEMLLPWKLAELITFGHVEFVEFTPARLQMCLTNSAFFQAIACVRVVIICGEVLTPVLLHKVHQATSAITFNGYGPTECTVYMTFAEVSEGKPITIGRPIRNGRIYVLDERQKPVLPTACESCT
jgi:non-ribosomal peptide synthetase component F